MRSTMTVIAFILSLISIVSIAQAQPQDEMGTSIQAVVDSVIKPAMELENIPGMAVGVSKDGKRYTFTYGVRNDAGDPFAPDTIVEIGSITKVFTTALLSEAVIQGQMSLQDSIQLYMPDNIKLKPRARQVTLLELATFSAGLPDSIPNLPRRLEMRSIEHYTMDDFLRFFKHWEPKTQLPAPYLYSNISIGLLGVLVANRAGKPWKQLLKEEITGPLQMKDTVMQPSDD